MKRRTMPRRRRTQQQQQKFGSSRRDGAQPTARPPTPPRKMQTCSSPERLLTDFFVVRRSRGCLQLLMDCWGHGVSFLVHPRGRNGGGQETYYQLGRRLYGVRGFHEKGFLFFFLSVIGPSAQFCGTLAPHGGYVRGISPRVSNLEPRRQALK